jgi:CheY-like chemotaxis protein
MNRAGLFLGSDSSERGASPRPAYQPFYGFPRSLRIIVADDHKDTVVTLKAILDDEGHDVMGAYNGVQVLVAASEFRPDVVILDLAMPGLDGYEIAKEIRERFGAFHPLLIAVSGLHNDGPGRALSRVAGFDHHLAKPCDPAQILALIAPLAKPDER